MKGIKLRLLAMGAIISVLGLALIVSRGAQTGTEGLLGVGLVLLLIGALLK